jgi:hypothetical protein
MATGALELGLRFLGNRADAWLTVKQCSWLLDVIARECRERTWPRNRGFVAHNPDGDGWNLDPCAPNGAAIIRRVPQPTPAELRRREFERRAEPLLRAINDAAAMFDAAADRSAIDAYRALCREFGDVTGSK